MKQAYAYFYVLGREERALKNDIDTEQIANHVLDGKGTIHELTRAAVEKAADALRVDRKKRVWLEEYSDEISEAGGDGEEAYNHYVDGRIDTTTSDLEEQVFEDLAEEVAPGDGQEDGEDDDEDEEEGDDE